MGCITMWDKKSHIIFIGTIFCFFGTFTTQRVCIKKSKISSFELIM